MRGETLKPKSLISIAANVVQKMHVGNGHNFQLLRQRVNCVSLIETHSQCRMPSRQQTEDASTLKKEKENTNLTFVRVPSYSSPETITIFTSKYLAAIQTRNTAIGRDETIAQPFSFSWTSSPSATHPARLETLASLPPLPVPRPLIFSSSFSWSLLEFPQETIAIAIAIAPLIPKRRLVSSFCPLCLGPL